jgi:hypothetical protein
VKIQVPSCCDEPERAQTDNIAVVLLGNINNELNESSDISCRILTVRLFTLNSDHCLYCLVLHKFILSFTSSGGKIRSFPLLT